MKRKLLSFFSVSTLALALAGGAQAAEFPSQPITWIVPYAAGGGSDVTARSVAEVLASELGAKIVVDNKPGAGTAIGAQAVARAAPDGYTIGTADSGTLAFNPSLYSNLSYDVDKSFDYVGGLASMPLVLVTRKGLEVNSVQELLALARKNPGELTYASAGAGSPHHVAMEMFLQKTGTRMTHVPYKGAAPAVLDVLGDRVDVMLLDMPGGIAHMKAGKVKLLAAAMPARLQALPDVPTMAEAGVDDFVAYAWQGVIAPAGTPQPVLDRLGSALRSALESEKIQARFTELGVQPMPMSAAEFKAHVDTEGQRWSTIINTAGIKLD